MDAEPEWSDLAIFAFRMAATNPHLRAQLDLAVPEKFPARDPNEWGTLCFWEFTSITIDEDGCRIVYRFERTRSGILETKDWTLVPWAPEGAPSFEPVLSLTLQTLKLKARVAWEAIGAALSAALTSGSVTARARIGSPVASERSRVPVDAWLNYDIDDWGLGTASSDGGGEKLYAIQVREGREQDQTPDKPKRAPQLELAIKAISEIYPEGVPDNVPDQTLQSDVEIHLAAQGEKRFPSKDTIRRARGSRK